MKPLLNGLNTLGFGMTFFGMAICLAAAANASCADPTTRYASENLIAFVDDPHSLLDRYPSGSELLASEVTAIASASSMALAPLLQAARAANKDQGLSIGKGLARATGLCRLKDASMAAEIGKLAERSGNMDVIASFRAHSYDDDSLPTMRKVFGVPPANDDSNERSGSRLSFRLGRTLPDPFAPVTIK